MFLKNKQKNKQKNTDYSVYIVTDRFLCPPAKMTETIQASILGGATVIQLREKNVDSLTFYKMAQEILEWTKKYEIPLIINDRLDIMLASGADGLHVGQSDLPAAVARKLIGPDKILGVSVTTIPEAKAAEADGADYLGVGAIFSTSTKNDAAFVSIQTLKEIKNAVQIPVVAIGGISKGNMARLSGTNIDGVAVVSAVMGSADPEKATEEIKSAFKMIK
ncbi:thiamine phosphate synthase [Methanolapillus ohkumae]|uniref:Thiamine-phosphate synthase n=1 Tax=Methanolapillus ohkumae TaxID=3028298 RepID=A0AA96V7E9_9EURY|nr:Thiamine-phosphate synthase [Methanosarcinaceae archaeon Am2]